MGCGSSNTAVSDLKKANTPRYTKNDVENNNAEKGKYYWFLYGRKVYSLDLLIPNVLNAVKRHSIISDQKNNPIHNMSFDSMHWKYPVYEAKNLIGRKHLNAILPVCQIGILTGMSREEDLSQLKHSVEQVKTDLEEEEILTENLVDYLEQLLRWLHSYPNVELETTVGRKNVDPNLCKFPLPVTIKADCSVLRSWARGWRRFDMTMDKDGAWRMLPRWSCGLGDTHQIFADMVAKRVDNHLPGFNMEIEGEAAWDVIKLDAGFSGKNVDLGNFLQEFVDSIAAREDKTLPSFDMEIEGEAAWNVIELYIVKNDTTTEEQDKIWKTRSQRKYLDDPERMRRRRKQIEDNFLSRHNTKLSAKDMIPYADWASRLEQHWKIFQELCKTFAQKQTVSEEIQTTSNTTDLEPGESTFQRQKVSQELEMGSDVAADTAP